MAESSPSPISGKNDPQESILGSIHRRASRKAAKILLPEGEDPRVLEAAFLAQARGLCQPSVVGSARAVRAAAEAAGIELTFPILEPTEDPVLGDLRELLRERLEARGGDGQEAEQLILDPLFYACARVAAGASDGAVMGAVATTADSLRAALRTVGVRPGLRTVSSCFLMVLPEGRGLIYTDCGVVPHPSPEQLADIAESGATSCRQLLGEEPKVAFLSFSTLGSARHPRVTRVRQGLEILRQRGPDFEVDGELQADAALIPEVARRKAPASPVAGGANVLVFPDLDSGNIAYKLTERLAGARAVGPLIQGLRKPIHDLSRGCSTEDILDTMAVAALQGRGV